MKQKLAIEGLSDHYSVTLKNKRGLEVSFNNADLNTIDRLKDLPVADILNLINLSSQALRIYLSDYSAYLKDQVCKIISLSWVYRMDNSPFQLENHSIADINMDVLSLKKALKSKKCSFSDQQLESFLAWFNREETEVKVAEDSIEMKIAKAAAKFNQ